MHLPDYRSLLLAGHDTTANTMTWFLWEIAKHPESQDRIRAEITALRALRGGGQFSITDLDNMAYTLAALKVLGHRIVSFHVTVSDGRPGPLRSR
jgi:alkylphenol/PAH-inducible cytochrome P450 monooxygenase